MNPLNKDEIKAKVVAELEIAHLPPDEQETIIATLAEALLERATTIIMAKIPDGEFANVDALVETGDQETLKEKIIQFVPDAPQIIDMIVRDGVAEYKQLVEQEKAEVTAEATSAVQEPAAPAPVPVVPEVSENFVVDENGEAHSADQEQAQPSSPLINPKPPQQPAY